MSSKEMNGACNGQSNGVSGHHSELPVDSTFKDLLPWSAKSAVTDQYINDVEKMIIEHVHKCNKRDTRVIDFLTPDDLMREIDFNIHSEGQTLKEVYNLSEKVLHYCVKTAHPRFFNQLYGGLDINAMLGQWIAAAANTSMATFEISPVFTVMEKFIFDKMCSLIGYPEGDGMIFPGGSMSNIQAMNIARYCAIPDVKRVGLSGAGKLTVFVSEEGHYSNMKAAALLGIGMDNVIKVRSDERHKLIVSDLECKIKESFDRGEKPFFVCATAATTVAGAFDDYKGIADVCQKYGIWMHIDAAYGGSALLAKKHRHLMNGCERSDSFTWNPHKLMGCTMQCSVLLTKKSNILQECNQLKATYLFQKDKKHYDPKWDTGDKSILCGRSVDVLKLWMMWKAKGDQGMDEQVAKIFSNARYLADEIKKREHFELVIEPECTTVCFYFIPPSARHLPAGPERDEKLKEVAPILKTRMTVDGTMLIGYQPLKDKVNFFRLAVINAAIEKKDMDFVLDEFERLGKDL